MDVYLVTVGEQWGKLEQMGGTPRTNGPNGPRTNFPRSKEKEKESLTSPLAGAPALVLASGSAGRLAVLRSAGIDPEVVVSGVDETCDDRLETAALVTVLAERKAAAVASIRPDALVLGCDSMLDLDRVPLGKPTSAADAMDMLRRLSGREATLLTGHCLIEVGGYRRVREVGRTVVRFGTPTDAELTAYVATGEPLALAGAFSIDGLGAPFIDGIDGDPGNVIGLSLPLLRRMLAVVGVVITDLWRSR